MFANLNPDALGMDIDLARTIELAVAHGFSGIDLPGDEIAAMSDPARAGGMLDDAGLQRGRMGLPVEFRSDGAVYDAGMSGLAKQAKAVSATGCTRCTTYIMPGHNDLAYAENFELHVARLKPAAKILADVGIQFGVEFVGPKTLRSQFAHEFAYTIDQMLELADAIGSGTGVLLDSFHWYCTNASEADITQKLAGKIVEVHVNDGRAGRGPDEQIDGERALPFDTGVIDLNSFAKAVRATGYDGPVTAEPMQCESIAGLGIDQVAGLAAVSVKRVVEG